MKIAVIHDSPIPSPSSRQLLISLVSMGAEASYVRISRISPVIKGGEFSLIYGRKNLMLDGALVRGLGLINSIETLFKRLSVIKHLELSNKVVMNSSESILKARDKFVAYQTLKMEGLPTPPTILTEDIYLVPEIVKEWGSVVIKPLIGSMGYGAVLVRDPDVAYVIGKAWQTHGQPILVQKYVRKKDRDIRILVIGEEVIGGIYREAPENTWKTNVAQGGKARKVASLTEELRELALKSTEILGLDYSGVDIGESDEGYVIYEVNAMPNWQGFMEATGINPAKHIAEFIVRKLKK